MVQVSEIENLPTEPEQFRLVLKNFKWFLNNFHCVYLVGWCLFMQFNYKYNTQRIIMYWV